MKIYRRDQVPGGLRALRRDANGFLHFEAHAARVGVLSYADVGGPRELTPAEVLFEPASMQSLIGMPITDQHPPEKLLDPMIVRGRQLGSIYGVRQDGDYLVASGVITDGALADKVEKKQQTDVSPGYRLDAEPKTGVWTDGERFDSVQTARRYNHFAIVDVGRCSRSCGGGDCKCAVRTDGQGAKRMKPKMIRLDGQTFMVTGDMLETLLEGKSPEEQATFWKALALGASQEADQPDEKKPPVAPPAPGGSPVPARTDAMATLIAERDAAKAAAAAAEKALEKSRADAVSQGDFHSVLKQVEVVCPHYDPAGKSVHQMRLDGLAALNSGDEPYLAEIKGYSELAAKEAWRVAQRDPRMQVARQNAAAGGLGAFSQIGRADGVGQTEDDKAIAAALAGSRALNGRTS